MNFAWSGRGEIWMLVGLLSGVLVAPAPAWVELEDFEAGSTGGFNNAFFRHDIGPDEFFQYEPVMYGFDVSSAVSPSHSLNLTPGTDYVTFVLDDGEYVDYARVWMRSVVAHSPTTFHVLGFDDTGRPLEYSASSPEGDAWTGDWMLADTLGAGFAEITEVRLTGLTKGMFDDLAVNVVPEPATLALMGLGLLWLARPLRRRGEVLRR